MKAGHLQWLFALSALMGSIPSIAAPSTKSYKKYV